MEKTAIYRIPYGLYYLGARSGDRQNICVVNTVQQVTDAPQRISVTVLKSNLTCEMIAASRAFSAAILDMDPQWRILRFRPAERPGYGQTCR